MSLFIVIVKLWSELQIHKNSGWDCKSYPIQTKSSTPIWGPYIKFGKNNYKIPKGIEAEQLTYKETLEIIESQPDADKKKGKFAAKKK